MISEPIRDLDQLNPTTGRIPLAAPDVRPLLGWIVPPLIALLIAAVAIEVWVRLAEVSVWVMPRPTGVIENFFSDFGRYFNEGLKTLGVSLGGLAIGTAAATLLAAGVAHSQVLERAVLPIAIMVKVTPVVALIPLFIIWFGHGWNPKIAIAALITYFPVLINAIAGFRDVDPRMHDYFRSVDASTWEIFRHLRLPAAVPYLFASLKISVTLSLIGAVVAEFFLSGQGGLGAVIWIEQNNLRLEQVFAAVLMLTLIGVTLSTAVVVAERLFSWRLDQPVTAS
ncbi:MAG: ABC transporter permease [Chloroflexi bacterium]|nr:ABC transporter permease [Chloroflexota bacterium]MCY3588644.1 ABC transporter permease [Chloroflexota bacterium]MCY3686046.1 ABC transporter permease [Chloroflexota bacterium]MDE2709879.1 ABC transporter permease [Chloroflexota bacterium]MXY86518.1 ABC transporter permease [Chloroflexota bacterium]